MSKATKLETTTEDIESPNGSLTILRVQVAHCATEDCKRRVRKGSDLCASHYRIAMAEQDLAEGSDSDARFEAYTGAWNLAEEVATKALKGKTPKGTKTYVLRTTNARSGFAYWLANEAGLKVNKPSEYGKARTFDIVLPNDTFAKAFAKALNGSDIAGDESVTFNILRVL